MSTLTVSETVTLLILTSESWSHGKVVFLDAQQLLGFDQERLGAVLLFQFVVNPARCERGEKGGQGLNRRGVIQA